MSSPAFQATNSHQKTSETDNKTTSSYSLMVCISAGGLALVHQCPVDSVERVIFYASFCRMISVKTKRGLQLRLVFRPSFISLFKASFVLLFFFFLAVYLCSLFGCQPSQGAPCNLIIGKRHQPIISGPVSCHFPSSRVCFGCNFVGFGFLGRDKKKCVDDIPRRE